MARPKKPIELHLAKGNIRHLTKAEIEERKNTEVKAANDNVEPPSYLKPNQKKEFVKIAKELIRIDIMSNLDCDSLASFIIARDNYLRFTKLVDSAYKNLENIVLIEKAVNMQDKAFKQCRSAASDLGLTISSRCRLVVPKSEEQPKENKFNKYASG